MEAHAPTRTAMWQVAGGVNPRPRTAAARSQAAAARPTLVTNFRRDGRRFAHDASWLTFSRRWGRTARPAWDLPTLPVYCSSRYDVANASAPA